MIYIVTDQNDKEYFYMDFANKNDTEDFIQNLLFYSR